MKNSKKNILIVDDDKNICSLLKLYLQEKDYNLYFAYDGSKALTIFQEKSLDIILLDIMLPIINGWEVCKIIRNQSQIPIIMLTACNMIEDKILGFDIGADDYIVKPFDPREVVVRIKARLKKNIDNITSISDNNTLKIGNLILNYEEYEVKIDDKIVKLKPREIQLLYFLLTNKNIVFSRDTLLERVWNYSYLCETRTVDVHIKRLRKNIESKCKFIKIKTIWGVGYKLEVNNV